MPSLRLCLASSLTLAGVAVGFELQLPTANHALLEGNGPDFYMYVDRSFEGERSTPWEGGQFGFVRTPKRTSAGVMYSRFHEGLDIKPVQRDATGEPQDPILAIADGTVVHASTVSSHSNYGRYVVVEHVWSDGPYYSLYAHLAEIDVKPGEKVSIGSRLGRMGYTGAGIDKRRAHLHLELGILISSRFESWHDQLFRDPNRHGIYNGMNLLGINLGSFFIAHSKNPALTVSQFIRSNPFYFELAVPGQAPMEILERYPWLLQGPAPSRRPGGWKIRCTAWGIPLSVTPTSTPVTRSAVTEVAKPSVSHKYQTRGLLHGSGSNGYLSDQGHHYVNLLIGTF